MSTFDFDVTCKVNITFTVDMTDDYTVEAINALIEDEEQHLSVDDEVTTLTPSQIDAVRRYISEEIDNNADDNITDICAVWDIEVGNEAI
jgi:hypothetical protein